MKKDIHKMTIKELKEIAKSLGLKSYQNKRKSDLLELIINKLEENFAKKEKKEVDNTIKSKTEKKAIEKDTVTGYLEVVENKDFGFLRFKNFTTSDKDVYVSPVFIRKFNLKTGDEIVADCKKNNGSEKFRAAFYIRKVNGESPEKAKKRKRFMDMTPIHPKERINLVYNKLELSTRLIDIFAPVGRGQRGLIVAPPKAGKTVLLQNIAKSIEANYPDISVLVLLIDERPEEVTEMNRSIKSDVIYSTFDQPPENHIRVAELVLERAMAMAEMGKDVVVLLDSITRLARAYNLETAPSGRTLSGGIDPAALHLPKKFFGAARCLEEGGSITILATALIETGSRMDDVIFEEFKGTGNMELILTRALSEKRVFPAIDIAKSGTRREELILSQNEVEFIWNLRRTLDKRDQAILLEDIINLMIHTSDNEEFLLRWKEFNI